jgi:hypothetical protein
MPMLNPASPSEVRSYKHLPMLRQAIQTELGIKQLAKTANSLTRACAHFN